MRRRRRDVLYSAAKRSETAQFGSTAQFGWPAAAAAPRSERSLRDSALLHSHSRPRTSSSALAYRTTAPGKSSSNRGGHEMAALSAGPAAIATTPGLSAGAGCSAASSSSARSPRAAVNYRCGFFGRSLGSRSAVSRNGSAARPSRRLGVAFATVAPSPAQTPVEQKETEETPTIITRDGKKIECYGVFCVTYDLKEDERPKTWKKLVRIAVSGAAGAIANHLVFKLASGEVFGPDQPIALNLLGSIRSRDALEGVAMELEDSLFPLLREVNIGIDPAEVFADADWALLIGAKPRGPGMERADLLDLNGQIFVEQAKALNEVASPNVKVLVVGNPCNTNTLIAIKNAPRIPAKNFHALTRLDENRAKCQLALKAGVFYDNVSNVTIWGNHSTTQVPDFLNAKIHGRKVVDVISDRKWLEEEFTPRVQTRGGLLIKKWGRSSAASTAVSIADAIKSLITPTEEGDWFSSAVFTTGNPYGIAEDIVYSMPCRSKGDGDYELVSDVIFDDWLKKRMQKSQSELLSEKQCVGHLIGEAGGFCDITEDTMLPGEQ